MADERAIEAAIFALFAERLPGATICPSEVARALSADWRPLMSPIRDVAFRLAGENLVEIRQKGQAVPHDPPPRGPIRLAPRNGRR